eukprot:3431376-Lingulodinium_polyedra.AAC.1
MRLQREPPFSPAADEDFPDRPICQRPRNGQGAQHSWSTCARGLHVACYEAMRRSMIVVRRPVCRMGARGVRIVSSCQH